MTDIEPEEVLCTAVFRLNKGQRDVGRFLYALACRVETLKHVDVVSLSVGDFHYPHLPDAQQEIKDDQ
ncbi:hypothetical protein OH708_01080 [Pseudomonas capsici]|uniref:hypothetical protein n=1 Tax=Pseudomonas capsici TaxID=2810614 RepID=UPI000E3C83AC|nr:hypothetical protein [Pseudomonas capsici]MCV4286489.1 hypothetical protein [Pseudomonas capsici]